VGVTSGRPSIKLASRFSSGIRGRGLVDLPRDGEPSRAKDESMRADVEGRSKELGAVNVKFISSLSSMPVELAGDVAANAQLSRGECVDAGVWCCKAQTSALQLRHPPLGFPSPKPMLGLTVRQHQAEAMATTLHSCQSARSALWRQDGCCD
jgi:hypothetical protein